MAALEKKDSGYILVKNPAEEPKKVSIPIGAFGLNNVGAICYFNSLLQGILSCKSIYDTIQDITIDSDLNKTLTGKAFIQTVRTAMSGNQLENKVHLLRNFFQHSLRIWIYESAKQISVRCKSQLAKD